MPLYGEVESFDNRIIGAGVFANVSGLLLENQINADPQYIGRPGTTATFVQSTIDPGEIRVQFKYNGYAAKKALLQALDYPHNSDERLLRVYRGDEDSPILCSGLVAVKSVIIGVASIDVIFDKANPVWVSTTPVTLSTLAGTLRIGTSDTIILPNAGQVRAKPTYKFGWDTQRASFTDKIGWRYRRQVTVTNESGEDWHDEPIVLDLGDTAAWVTGSKALSSGNDVRVWSEGQDLPRTLVNFNTKRTFLWVLVSLPAADDNDPDANSATLDIVYGNTSAGSPQTLSLRTGTGQTYVAFDLEGVHGTADSGSSSTLLATIGTTETDRWNRGFLQITGGTGSGQRRRILDTSYSAGTTTFTVARNFSTSPDNTSTFCVWRAGVAVDGGRVTARTATSIDDSSQSWGTAEWEDATVTFIGGSGATPATMTVSTHDADTLNFTGSFSVQPAVNDSYTIERMGAWIYVVDTAITESAHRGLYRINHYYEPPTRTWANGDTPGGWQLATYLPDNGDDYAHFKPYDTGSGGGHGANFWSLLRPRRRVGQEKTYKNEGNADGLMIYSPFKFIAAYWDWQIKNINGVGRVVFSVLESGGEDWSDVVTYTTTQATLTNIAAQWADLTDYNNPTRLFMGALPADTTANKIPTTASPDDEVEVRTNDIMELYLVLDSFGDLSSSRYVVGSEEEIYDLNVRLRIGGGNDTDKTPPYDVFQAGGTNHKIGIKATEELWLTTDPSLGRPLLGVYATSSLVYAAPWAGRIYRYRTDVNGDAIATQAMDFVPLPPALNMIENGDFATNDVSNWTMTVDPGVTATKGWTASPSYDTTGSMDINITAAPVGAWSIILTYPTLTVIPGKAYPFGFKYRVTDTGATILPQMAVSWQSGASGDADQFIGSHPSATGTWYRAASENYTWTVPAGVVSANVNVTEADVSIQISGSGNYSGHVYLDMITFGVPAAWITETAAGTTTFDAVWEEGVLV